MEIISSLIPLFIIISIVFSIVNKAKQAQNKSANKGSAAQNTQTRSSSLQEIIRRQIEEQRNAVSGTPPQSAAQPPKPEPVDFSDGKYAKPNAPTEKRYREGEALNRKTLEGTPVEMQRHSHDAHIGGSYNEGDALNRSTLEGSPIFEYEDKFDLDEEVKVSRRGKRAPSKKKSTGSRYKLESLKFDTNGIVNGIIMSEILSKRGGRRAIR